MKKFIWGVLVTILLLATITLQVMTRQRMSEITDTLKIQSEIEVKRTTLMVVHQEVLRNVVRKVDELKRGKHVPDFGLPESIGE